MLAAPFCSLLACIAAAGEAVEEAAGCEPNACLCGSVKGFDGSSPHGGGWGRHIGGLASELLVQLAKVTLRKGEHLGHWLGDRLVEESEEDAGGKQCKLTPARWASHNGCSSTHTLSSKACNADKAGLCFIETCKGAEDNMGH